MENFDKGTIKRNTQRQIFVAGIPSDFEKNDAMNYFKEFGSIISIREKKMPSGGRAFILKTGTEETFREILFSKGNHVISGRLVQCRPYERGKRLIQHNISMNKRRVIIKKVPSQLDVAELVNSLEKLAGPIESIYSFSTEQKKKRLSQTYKRKFKVYSVLFIDPGSAQKAISLESHSFIDGLEPSTIEKFRIAKTKASKKVDAASKVVNDRNLDDNNFLKKSKKTENLNQVCENAVRDSDHLLHFYKPTDRNYHQNKMPSDSNGDQVKRCENLLFKVLKPSPTTQNLRKFSSEERIDPLTK